MYPQESAIESRCAMNVELNVEVRFHLLAGRVRHTYFKANTFSYLWTKLTAGISSWMTSKPIDAGLERTQQKCNIRDGERTIRDPESLGVKIKHRGVFVDKVSDVWYGQ